MASTAILIPARYASSRFPGKPLAKLGDLHMIQRVYQRCRESGLDTYVLTDQPMIIDLFSDNTLIVDTSNFENGTERCAGAVKKSVQLDGYDTFVNVQGDMPDVTTEMIEKCAWHLKHYPVTTVFTDMPEDKQNDPGSVKMVRAGDQALWFGRGMTGYGNWHLGVYGYRRNALEMYPSLAVEQEERVEKLEQLRWLKGGWNIGCLHVDFDGIEINTPEDAEEWNKRKNTAVTSQA